MGRPRIDFHNLLIATSGLPSQQVYFQPPENVQLKYPCIVYKRDRESTQFADDNPWRHNKRYQVTVIDRNPDSEIPDAIRKLRMCLFDRNFASDNLNHDVFNIYF